jgi:N-methylhydantoinase B
VPPGVYTHAFQCDGYEEELTLAATLSVSADGILLDYAGTSPCSRKGINVPINYATAYSVFALRTIIGPDIPNNAGSLEPFKVVGPPGCILNARPPAPVAMRHTLGQLTPDLVFGCLHQALPERVPAEGASCMYDLPMRHVPESAGDPAKRFASEPTHNGGTGARPSRDGLSATAFPSGVWGSMVEITEAVAPVRIARRELRRDSGGAGRHRGGLGQRIELEAATEDAVMVFLSMDRIRHPAQGRAGGLPGAPGRIHKKGGPDLPGRGEVRVAPGETLIVETPGGGGFGDPRERDRDAVRRDVVEDNIAPETARTVYGLEGAEA